jgi:hypothetical protein
VGVLLAGSLVLLATATAGVVFYLSVVRSARGLPAYTAGLPPATMAHPLRRRAVYHAVLLGPADRETPAGTPSTVHRWRVVAPAAPDDELCAGQAMEDIVAADATGERHVMLPVPLALFLPGNPQPVPPRVMATCPAAQPAMDHAGMLEYAEDVVPRRVPVEVVACLTGKGDEAVLGACDDGAPSRIYPRESVASARARTRGATFRVAGFAAAFALLCFTVGFASLRRFDRVRRAER